MNLAIPINVISEVDLTREGTPIPEVLETENAKKAVAVLTADQTEISLEYGEKAEIMVSHTCPGPASIRYENDGWGIVNCVWGRFVTKRSVPLTIYAVGEGEAEITIRFDEGYGNEDSEVVIHVTVTGAPEETEDPLPSGVVEYQP